MELLGEKFVCYVPLFDSIIVIEVLKNERMRVDCLPEYKKLLALYFTLEIENKLEILGEL